MGLWEIRFHEQPPVRVQVPDDRKLGVEYEAALRAFLDPPKPRGRRKPTPPSPVWHLSEEHHYHIETIVGVRRLDPPPARPRAKRPIGFTAPEG